MSMGPKRGREPRGLTRTGWTEDGEGPCSEGREIRGRLRWAGNQRHTRVDKARYRQRGTSRDGAQDGVGRGAKEGDIERAGKGGKIRAEATQTTDNGPMTNDERPWTTDQRRVM